MNYRCLHVSVILLVGIYSLPTPTVGQSDKQPDDLKKIDVIEHLGEHIPLDLQFVNSAGDTVWLREYFQDDKPVVLTLGYYQCPMLCNLVWNGLSNGLRNLDWTPGEEYRVLTVSIDPTETSELAKAKRYRYMEDFGKPIPDDGWLFLTGEEEQIGKLANAVGFQYFYIDDKEEYAHPAVIFILSPEGKISRYLYGIEYKGNDLKFGLLEASEGKIGSTLDRIILYCYHYDPNASSYVIFAGNLMRIGGGITAVLLVLLLGSLWTRERLKSKKQT